MRLAPGSRKIPRRRQPRGARALAALLVAACLLVPIFAGCSSSDPLQEARDLQAAGDFAGSLEPLRAILGDDPDDPEVNYLYGHALAMTGQASLAEWSLRKAMDDSKWRQKAGTQLAFGELATGNYPAAIASLTDLLESDPDDLHLLLMRANAYAHSRMHPEEALADVARIQELDPTNADAMEPKILALLGLGRDEEAGEAIDELGRLIEENQLEPSVQGWYCATTAIFADESGEIELARTRWEDCLTRFPDHPNVVSSSVEFFDENRNYGRSLEILRAAHAASPSSRDYRVWLAQRLRAMGNASEAEGILRAATENEQPALAAGAWFDLAKHHQEVGDDESAAEDLGRAIERAREAGPVPPQMLLEYGDALLLAGRFDEALAVADETTVEAHREMIRARVAQERGKPAEALEHFDDALRLWPDNPWARYYAARAAEAVGDFDRAIEAYRYSIRIEAGATDARVRLARLHLAEGRPNDALVMLRAQTQNAPLDVAGELLSLRLWSRLARHESARAQLELFRRRGPVAYATALAAFAEGIRERSGPAAAVRALRSLETLDLQVPSHAEALRELVVLSREAHERGGDVAMLDAARADLQAALKAHPDAGAFHEIEGWLLEQDGRSDEARAAYERALELDPQNVQAATGLGRLALEQDPEAALVLFDRAAAADPTDVDAARGAARALVALGRPQKAAQRLENLLGARPDAAAAAAQLAGILLESDGAGDNDRILRLAEQAVRFGGGEEARAVLARARERAGPSAGVAKSPGPRTS